MAAFLDQIERDWLSRHVTGATPQMPLNQIRRLYYTTYLGALAISVTPNFSLADLELQWMIKYLQTAVVTPTSDYKSDLWKQMVLTTGKTPVKTINANRLIFFSNAL